MMLCVTSTSCAVPPSVCLSIKTVSIENQSFIVEWERPTIIGREDYHYILSFSDGRSLESFQVINRSQIVSAQISDLKPATQYSVTVTVVNGVSDQDQGNKRRRECRIQVTTLDGGIIELLEVSSYVH